MSVPADKTKPQENDPIKEKFGQDPLVYAVIAGNEELQKKILAAIKNDKIGDSGFHVARKDDRGVVPDGFYYDFRLQRLTVSQELYEGLKSKDPEKIKAFESALSAAADESANPKRQFEKYLDRLTITDKKKGPQHDDRLSNVFDKSPYMAELAITAIENNNLRSIYDVKPSVLNNAGASYNYKEDSRRILVSNDGLDRFEKNGALNGDTEKYEFIFQLGHELGHASRGKTMRELDERFIERVKEISATKDKPRDYTEALSEFLQGRRTEEAKAHIDGFNAVASALKKENPKATLADLRNALPEHYRDDFFKNNSSELKEGLAFDKALFRLPHTETNIGKMKEYYFDQPAKEAKLGKGGNGDYKNLYASQAVQMLYENVPAGSEVRINLKLLKLDEGMVEKNLRLDNNQKQPFIDTSDGKDKPRHFDPGVKTDLKKNATTPKQKSEVPPTPANTSDSENKPKAPTTAPGHNKNLLSGANDRKLLDQSRSFLDAGADRFGAMNDEQRTNLVGAVAECAIRGGLKNIDHVVLSSHSRNLIAIEGKDPTLPQANRCAVDIAQGQQQPFEKSVASIELYRQQTPPATELQIDQPQQGKSIGARTM